VGFWNGESVLEEGEDVPQLAWHSYFAPVVWRLSSIMTESGNWKPWAAAVMAEPAR
jgi:hypothetical protein